MAVDVTLHEGLLFSLGFAGGLHASIEFVVACFDRDVRCMLRSSCTCGLAVPDSGRRVAAIVVRINGRGTRVPPNP